MKKECENEIEVKLPLSKFKYFEECEKNLADLEESKAVIRTHGSMSDSKYEYFGNNQELIDSIHFWNSKQRSEKEFSELRRNLSIIESMLENNKFGNKILRWGFLIIYILTIFIMS